MRSGVTALTLLFFTACSSGTYSSGYEILQESGRCVDDREIETFDSFEYSAICVIQLGVEEGDDLRGRLSATVEPDGLSPSTIDFLTDPDGWETIILGDSWYVMSERMVSLPNAEELADKLGGQLVVNKGTSELLEETF